MKNEALVKTGEEVVKKRGRGGKENFPSVLPSDAKSEDIKRIMKDCLRWYELPRINTDEECRQRLYDFFVGCAESGELATIEKMCLALGYARNTVFEWEQGLHCSPERSNMIKKAKALIATTESVMVSEGKINPVVYIFRAKNYFGMKDQQDIVVKPDSPLGDYQNPDEIQKRIEASAAED